MLGNVKYLSHNSFSSLNTDKKFNLMGYDKKRKLKIYKLERNK